MKSLRTRLILAFLVATILPLGATIWITSSLIDRSLEYVPTEELDRLSRTLENTVRQFYQREREALKIDAAEGRVPKAAYPAVAMATWPEPVRTFWESRQPERFDLSGAASNQLEYLRRTDGGVDVFARDLGAIRMRELSDEYARSRAQVGAMKSRDLHRGFTLTLLLLVAAVWVVSLVPLAYIAHRVSRPIQQLTAGLTDFSAGNWNRHVDPVGDDEVGRAVAAFNHMAEQLRGSRERLIYLTQVASWQSLARKMAHELKNSLTPIRLTVEEMLARQPSPDRAFMEQAAQIVVGEIETLERRVRAFSEFSSEPPVQPETFELNAVVNERIALLRPAHPRTIYERRTGAGTIGVYASLDLVKGILTNLLENAAEAAGADGVVLTLTRTDGDRAIVEVHDSGPGLNAEARRTLFEPTITFKKQGMGLGLSIARKNAILAGGDLALVDGQLGGAAFRVVLPLNRDTREGMQDLQA